MLKRIKQYKWIFKNFTLQRFINLALVQASMKLKLAKTWGKPYSIMIEPTNTCNLGCPLCPTGNKSGDARPKGLMSFDTYKKTIDQMHSHLYEVVMWNYGEPFINPETYKFIEYAKQKGIPNVIVSTNAHFFRKDEQIERLIKSGLDRLIVSVDGMTPETYEQYRQGGDVKLVLDSLKKIVDKKQELGRKTPNIEMQFIVMKQNQHEVKEVVEYAKKVGVDSLILKKVNIYMGVKDPEAMQTEKYLPDNDDFVREEMDTRNCPIIKRSTVVNWNGEVVPCCVDYYSQYPMGNVNDDKFSKIWNNKKYVNFRRNNLKGKIPICQRCNTYTKDIMVKTNVENLEESPRDPAEDLPVSNNSEKIPIIQ